MVITHVLVAVDYDQEDDALDVFKRVLSQKFNQEIQVDYGYHNLCEGKYLLRFTNISCSDFKNICTHIFSEPNGLNRKKYNIVAYPDHMHSMPPSYYDNLCKKCNKLQ